MKKRLLIGVITTLPYMEMQSEAVRGVIAQAYRSGCDTVIISANSLLQHIWSEQRDHEKDIYRLISSPRFDGFIFDRRFFLIPKLEKEIEMMLVQSRKPVMLMDGTEHKIFENTSADDRKPFERLVTHMIETHDCKRIYCLTGPENNSDAQERLGGFFDAMNKHGLYYDKSYYRYGDFWKDSAIHLGEDIIAGELPVPDAVVCGNDISAAALINTLSLGGFRVPEDIAVAGFDCVLADFENDFSITSYKRATFQHGAESFRRLYRIITGKVTQRTHNEIEGLRIGRSCGCREIYTPKGREKRRLAMANRALEEFITRDVLYEANNAPDPTSAMKKISDYAFFLHDYSRFNICLTDEFAKVLRGGGDSELQFAVHTPMRLVTMRKSNGWFYTPDTLFNSDDILPEIAAPHKHPVAYFITPLHSGRHYYGYAAITFGKHAVSYNKAYMILITYLDSVLERLHKQAAEKHRMVRFTHDKMTGLPTVSTAEDMLRSGKRRQAFLICMILTDFRKRAISCSYHELCTLVRSFAERLSQCLREGEICAAAAPDSYIIITDAPERAKEISGMLNEKLRLRYSMDEPDLNIPYTMGECTFDTGLTDDLYQTVHAAQLNTVITCEPRRRTTESPLFDRLCRVRDEMRRDPARDWDIDTISAEVHISRSHLQKSYRSCFGSSIMDELIHFRIAKARELLTDTDMTVTEVSAKCGYSSYCYFTKQFKKTVGMTPSEYRSNSAENRK